MPKVINNRYELTGNLGEGGMSDVYLAHDTILNREVAIKILRGELGADPIALLRFQREANAVSKVTHDNVVDLYDVGEWNGRHYIVMEYVKGRTLKQLIQQRGALEKKEAVDIMIQLTSGVQAAHASHIIHRDIKPQNVLVKDDGTVKITDFGIALANDVVQLTSNDAVLGSAHYLAPEITRGEGASVQSDIYALGVVFYELLCGTPPFKGDTPVSIAMKHLQEEVPSILDFNPSLPQSIDNIIRKSTVKNMKYRYTSVQEMLDDLHTCLNKDNKNVAPVEFSGEYGHPTTVILSHKELIEDQEKMEETNRITQRREKNLKRLLISFLIVFSLFVGGALLYAVGVIPATIFEKSVTIPDMTNLTLEEATKELEGLGFDVKKISVETQMSDDVEKNHVISITPNIGESVKISSEINLIVSQGTYFLVEDYVNKDIDTIKETLEKVGIKVIVEDVQDAMTLDGTILEQSGLSAGEKIDPAQSHTITFKVARRPQFQMPDVVGMQYEDAMKLLKAKGAAVTKRQALESELTDEQKEKYKAGDVISSSPASGQWYVQEGENTIVLIYY